MAPLSVNPIGLVPLIAYPLAQVLPRRAIGQPLSWDGLRIHQQQIEKPRLSFQGIAERTVGFLASAARNDAPADASLPRQFNQRLEELRHSLTERRAGFCR